VTFAVGIFDLFTYTIPGSLYLGFLSYLAFRLHWVAPGAVGGLPTALLVVILVLASYLLGYAAYPVGALLNRVVPSRRDRQTRQEFLSRVPAARDRDYVQADSALLLSAIQLQDKDVAAEISRLRAAGLMLRNSAPAVVLGLVAATVEIFASGRPGPAAASTVVFAAGAVAMIIQGRRLSYWAGLKTLELAFWLPDVDEKTRAPGPS
jgi:hypothetical protein